MKKLTLILSMVSMMFAWDFAANHKYDCTSYALQIPDKNGKPQIIHKTMQNEAEFKRGLGDMYIIHIKANDPKHIVVTANNKSVEFDYNKTIDKGYKIFIDKAQTMALMPNKEEKTKDLVLIFPNQTRVFYQCR